ncbi:hypothetical protein LMH73_022460 [Vibrio splendidus]|nr:hypothetical protein [Vibrio splendidus]MCC4878470.1 hypothetical protein [Vibrio splendidus]
MKNSLQIYVRKALNGKAYAIGVLTSENTVFGNLTKLNMVGVKTSSSELDISLSFSASRFISSDECESSDDIESMDLSSLLKASIWSQSTHDFGGFAGLRDSQKFDFEKDTMTRAIFVSVFDNNCDILNGESEALFESFIDSTNETDYKFSLRKVDMDYSMLSDLDETDILRSPLWTLDNDVAYRLNHALTAPQIALLAQANRELVQHSAITDKTRHGLSVIGMDMHYIINADFIKYVIYMQQNHQPFGDMETRLLTEEEHNAMHRLSQSIVHQN